MANLDYKELKQEPEKIVYVIQEIPGTKEGRPKINIMGAQKFGKIKVLLREDSQMIFSPGPIIFELRILLKEYHQIPVGLYLHMNHRFLIEDE